MPKTTGGRPTRWACDGRAQPRLVYLPGIAGHPAARPPSTPLADAGWEVVVPDAPRLRRPAGLPAARRLPRLADRRLGRHRRHRCAARAPSSAPPSAACSAADLAALRPEVVTTLALLAPFGIFDDAHPGLDLYAVPDRRADGPPVRQGRARAVRRPLQRARPRRGAGGPLPLRHRRGQPDLAARRPWPGATAASHRLPDAGAVGRPGRAAAGRHVGRVGAGGVPSRGRGRRRPSARMGRARRGRGPPRRAPGRAPSQPRRRRRHRATPSIRSEHS